MPKQNLYYKLEEKLSSEDIEINEEKIHEGLFTFQIENAVIYVKGIGLIHFKKASFFSLLFFNNLKIEELVLDDSLESIAPTKLDELSFSYVVWSPQHMAVSGYGAFGKFTGEIDFTTHTVHLDLTETVKLGAWKHQLKKGEKGWYYETSF